jgi:hypothetical protein
MDSEAQSQFTDEVVAAAYKMQLSDMMGDAFAALPTESGQADRAEMAHAQVQAEALIQQHSFREWLCPALQSASDDVGEIAKIATPLLLKASLGPQAPITLSVLGCAAVAFVIARAGVKIVCPAAAGG